MRNNTGGNMWPMVLGLHPLIGNDIPGYFKLANKKRLIEWSTVPPQYGISIEAPYQVKDPKNKIAVLYSKRTVSSGEMTAICFIGKPNTRSFGTITGGYTTGNEINYLSEGNIFVLASTYVLDRNKKIYTGGITPDVLIDKQDNDTVIEQAKAWIKQ